MLLKPTRNWSVPFLLVPGVGKVTKANLLDLPPVAAQYLIAQRMVVRVTDSQDELKTEPDPIQQPVVVELPQAEVPPAAIVETELDFVDSGENKSSPEEDVESLSGDRKILEFLNTATASDIEAVRHIGKRTANEIIEARPLTLEDAQTLLTERQIEALISHQNQA